MRTHQMMVVDVLGIAGLLIAAALQVLPGPPVAHAREINPFPGSFRIVDPPRVPAPPVTARSW